MQPSRIALLLYFAAIPAAVRAQAGLAAQRLPESYLLQGVVRDSVTGAPVAGVAIWPMDKGWGAVSDAHGHFQLRWHGRAVWTFLVRRCNARNLGKVQADFFHDSVVHRNIVINASGQPPCTPGDRLPWSVDARDTTRFRGHYIYSWEGGGWLEACDGRTYTPDWDSALAARLGRRQRREGQRSFVEFRGRVAPDDLAKDVPPGMMYMDFPGPLYLVSRVDTVRNPKPNDCP